MIDDKKRFIKRTINELKQHNINEDKRKELLENTIKDFKNRTFNKEKITLKYWVKNMSNRQQQIQQIGEFVLKQKEVSAETWRKVKFVLLSQSHYKFK